jgi:glycosyltransferase involved in cell wall biosynthesis
MKVKVSNDPSNISSAEGRILEFIKDREGFSLAKAGDKPDLVYSFSPFWPGYKVLFYTPLSNVLYAPHCLGIHPLQGFGKNLVKRRLLKAFSNNFYLRCISRWEYDRYREMGISERRLFYCPLSIDYDSFSEIKPSKDSKEVFSVGNAREVKDLETQVRAVKELSKKYSEIKLNVIGGWKNEEYKSKIISLIEDLEIQDNVVLHGYKGHDEMRDIMSGCALCIHTSKFESQGLSIYEAAAAGFPICVSDVPVHNQNFERFKHPQGDFEALAEDIKTIFEMDEGEKRAISEEMKQLARNFSYEKETERLEKFFKQIGAKS